MRQNKEDNPISFEDIGKHIKVAKGNFDQHKLSVFSIFRDELFFVRAFFEHYRKLGIEQFLIIDDRSCDGTREFLSEQPDCVVLESEMTYGQAIKLVNRDGQIKDTRAGIFFKMAVPNHFFQDDFVLYVDADEFLILPEEITDLQSLCQILRSSSERSVASSIVEFFPRLISDLDIEVKPESFDDLVLQYAYFQPESVISLGGKKGYFGTNPSKSTRLFEQFDVQFEIEKRPILSRLKMAVRGRQEKPYRKTPKVKIPLLFCSRDSYFIGTHETSKKVNQQYLLTIVHFVFTNQMAKKIERAREWRSYASNSVKYDLYLELMEKMRAQNASFCDSNTVKYESVDQFLECGLMASNANSK